jgi:hypothetical protein
MPKQPVVTVNNPVGAAVARTAGQGITGAFIVDGLLAFNGHPARSPVSRPTNSRGRSSR